MRFTNCMNNAILCNRLAFYCPIMNRAINTYYNSVILLSQRANQRADYLNTDHSVISTNKDTTNADRNKSSTMVNITWVEKIMRENSISNNEVEIIAHMHNIRWSLIQYPLNTTILSSIYSFCVTIMQEMH